MTGRRGGNVRSAPLSTARLAAVQALYEIEVGGAELDPVIEAFMTERWRVPLEDGGEDLAPPDPDLLKELVVGVSTYLPEIDGYLGEGLNPPHTVDSIEALLRAVLRSGVYELSHRRKVPAVVVINEYVDIADAFFNGREPALVNGLLDRLAHALRESEFGEASDGGGREGR